MKLRSISSETSALAMTPSRTGRMTLIRSAVMAIIRFASAPTARTLLVSALMAT